MTRRLIGAAVIGVLGVAILVTLGVWQFQRLQWKTAILAEIDARIDADPAPLPAEIDPARDRFLPIVAEGRVLLDGLRVVAPVEGGGYRIISVFETRNGRRVLLDRGIAPSDGSGDIDPPEGEIAVRGHLHWPDEVDAFTPPPEPDAALWYARDVPAMADFLDAELVLIVAEEIPGDPVSQRPIDTGGIPNDHLEYAITWFSLAAIWAGMTGLLLWRIRRRNG